MPGEKFERTVVSKTMENRTASASGVSGIVANLVESRRAEMDHRV